MDPMHFAQLVIVIGILAVALVANILDINKRL